MLKFKELKGYLWLPLFGLIFLLIALKVRPDIEVQFYIQPLILTINLILILIFFVLSRKEIWGFLKSVSWKFWIAILLIFIFGLSLRIFVQPMHHKIYFDEDIYVNIAHNIANQGKACLCDYGTPTDCYICIDNKQPMGMPTFYGSLIRIFGWAGFGSESSFFGTNIFISSLSIVLIFLLVMLLSKNATAGAISALFLAINPTHIRWSVSTSQDAFFLTFLLLSIVLFLIEKRSWMLELLSFLVAAYTIQLRTEGMLILPIIAVLIIATRKKPFALLKQKEYVLGIALMLLFILPCIIHSLSNKEDSWGAPDGKKISADYFSSNASQNISFLFDKTKFPMLVTLFALIGLYYALVKHTKASLALLVWFGLFFLLYAFFYAGSFNYGMDVRFLLTMIAPLLVFSGFGLYYLFSIIWGGEINQRIIKRIKFTWGKDVVLILLVIAAAIIMLSSHWTEISEFGEEASDALKSHSLAEGIAAKASPNCIVISQVSSMFNNLGRTSIQTHRFRWGGFEEKIIKGYDCVYLDWGYWCASAEAFRTEQCEPILNAYKWDKIASVTHYEREFAAYKLIK